jgi:EAL domain-containing protein (putative c-di-GMP-specific phosphodiesterase class I)
MLEGLHSDPAQAVLQTRAIGQHILEALARPYPMLGDMHHNTCSMGAVLFDGHDNSVEELLKRADLAMYQAKAPGAIPALFRSGNAAGRQRPCRAGSALRRGLQQQEFQLYYQPQVDADGRITGAEALLRWQRPEHGLGAGQLYSAGRRMRPDRAAGRMGAAYRLSPAGRLGGRPGHRRAGAGGQCQRPPVHQAGFVDMVRNALMRSGAPAHRLKLELTESLLLQDVDDTVRKMKLLKQDGVCFSLDDFGTGYSSLSYIKRLPLDQLKIDQSFVRDIDSDANDVSIIRTIVALAGSMQLQVIAEGVETASQRFLLEQHCRPSRVICLAARCRWPTS